MAATSLLFIICGGQPAWCQDSPDLSLASSDASITAPQADEFGKAIEAAPSSALSKALVQWIQTARSGTRERAINASLAILLAAMRADGWELLSDRYQECLRLLNSPYPEVQHKGLLVAVHLGVRAPKATAAALRVYVGHGSRSLLAPAAEERGLRASAVQELLRLAPSDASAHDAIDALLAEDLSIDFRLLVIQALGDEKPATDWTVSLLLTSLDNSSAFIREAAVRALERLSGSGTAVLGTVGSKLLQMSIEDPEAGVRDAAKEALQYPTGTQPPLHIGLAE